MPGLADVFTADVCRRAQSAVHWQRKVRAEAELAAYLYGSGVFQGSWCGDLEDADRMVLGVRAIGELTERGVPPEQWEAALDPEVAGAVRQVLERTADAALAPRVLDESRRYWALGTLPRELPEFLGQLQTRVREARAAWQEWSHGE